jgi:toxin ParE1/3/4
MAYNVRIRVEAENDLQDAYSYFELCRTGLGADFMLCIEESLAKISRNPQHYPVVYNSIHRILVHRFPLWCFLPNSGSNYSCFCCYALRPRS